MTTQHERDQETGLDYRGARFYDAEICRFLSLDPLAETFPSVSDYNYVLGNPISLTDPSGKSPEAGYSVYVDGQKADEHEYGMWSRELSIFHSEQTFKEALKNAILISAAANADAALGSFTPEEESFYAQGYVGNLSTSFTGFGRSGYIIDDNETIFNDVEIQIQRWYILIDQISVINRGKNSRFNNITEIGPIKNTTDFHMGHTGRQAMLWGPQGDKIIKRGRGMKDLENPNPGKVVVGIMYFSEENEEHFNAAMNAFSRSFINRAINEIFTKQSDRNRAIEHLKRHNSY